MGKPQYNQAFWSEWLKDKLFLDWLSEYEGDPLKAFCKVCCCQIRAKRADLINHRNTKKHETASGAIRLHAPGSIKLIKLNNKTNHAEAAIALFVSAHCSILSSDHLGELCKLQFSGAHADNIHLHRTKRTAIINNVLCPYFELKLKDDIGNNKYSILVDESTDISVTKFLGIVIIYYSTLKRTIVTTFLGLEELMEGNALAIVNAIKSCLKKYSLNIKNMIGLGTDNASVMIGVNNGVHKLLKDENPYIVLIKCVCHSLKLATSHAVSENTSTLRQQAYYKELFTTLNDGCEPLKIVQASNTRWLFIEVAVSRVIAQCEEIENTETQWRKINLVSWKHTNSSIDFWTEVKEFKDAAQCYIFKELANFSLTVLCLPWSNAAVERIFSQMNIVKSKARNKIAALPQHPYFRNHELLLKHEFSCLK
ncbi:PREDICTED: uncharacterized protein LOC107171790 [Diuraphis noxia]|uniref:uncharacterized protein LOC107171790 n=1 Tax=Diuraphis noxia TaxID=143948 RepID=UPI0007637745|nr:PREDICTED: uncharacterized protein LOC107171790 [Diuraphis noxia]